MRSPLKPIAINGFISNSKCKTFEPKLTNVLRVENTTTRRKQNLKYENHTQNKTTEKY